MLKKEKTTYVITATDKAGNGEEQELTYYRDTVTPEAGYVKVTTKNWIF